MNESEEDRVILEDNEAGAAERDLRQEAVNLGHDSIALGDPELDEDLPSYLGEEGNWESEESHEIESEAVEEEEEESRSNSLRLGEAVLRKVAEIFVPPSDEVRRRDRRVESRIFVVRGPEQCGKLTRAIRLAQELLLGLANPSIICYSDRLSIVRATRIGTLPTDAVYIVEDAFDGQIGDKDLASPDLEALEAALRDLRSYLLLTTERDDQGIPFHVNLISAQVSDLEEVFSKHLGFYRKAGGPHRLEERLAQLADANRNVLCQKLEEPGEVEKFFFRLSLLPGTADIQELVKIADTLARVRGEAARPWFTALRPEAQLYAMLVVLVEGVDPFALFAVFSSAIEHLRTDGLTHFHDPRRLGKEDLFEQVRAEETQTGGVVLSRKYSDEAMRQVKNHNHLLWALAPILADLIEKSEAWEVRRSLGIALGRIGLHDVRRLEASMLQLAESPKAGATAAAGFALSELYRLERAARDTIFAWLTEWISSGNPRLMWMAGAALWRVYGAAVEEPESVGDRDRLLGLLEQLARDARRMSLDTRQRALQQARRECRDAAEVRRRAEARLRAWGGRNFSCSFISAVKIARLDPPRLVGRLGLWLSEGQPRGGLRRLAQAVSRRLFEQAGARGALLPPARRGELLQLVAPLLALRRDEMGAVGAMLAVLGGWIRKGVDVERTASVLLHAASRSVEDSGASTRCSLARHWLATGATVEERQLARQLIARSRAFEGLAPEAPGRAGPALLVLDVAGSEEAGPCSEAAALHLAELLGHGVVVVRLGSREVIGIGVQPAHFLPELRPHLSRPRLVMPSIETLGMRNFSVVLLAVREEIVDLEDASTESWADRILVVTSVPGRVGGRSAIPIDADDPERSLPALERQLDGLRVAALARSDLREWALPRASEQQSGEMEDKSNERAITSFAEALDRPDSLVAGKDLAEEVLRAILGLAATDPDGCRRLVEGWREGASESVRRMGDVGGRLLLRIEAQRTTPCSSELRELLLDVASHLIGGGWDSAVIPLAAARRWLAGPRSQMLDPVDLKDGVLARWLLQMLPVHRTEVCELLHTWRCPLPGEPGDRAPDSVLRVVERLEWRIALGAGSQEWTTGTQHACGVIVLDAGGGDPAVRLRLASLGADLLCAQKGDPPPLLFRLGERQPVLIPVRQLRGDELLPATASHRPRLLGPLLDTLPPAKVAFVLVLAAGPIVDAGDWSSESREGRLFWCGPPGTEAPLGWRLISVPQEAFQAEALWRELSASRGRSSRA